MKTPNDESKNIRGTYGYSWTGLKRVYGSLSAKNKIVPQQLEIFTTIR